MDNLFHPTLFIFNHDPAATFGEAELSPWKRAVAALSGLRGALAFTPMAPGDQPFAKDGLGPSLALQLDFADDAAADLAAAADGPLAALMRGPGFTHQRMLGRRFPAPDPEFRPPPGQGPCTFLVEYPGDTADLEGWLDHYDSHHPPIMARFPGIRDIATFRPAARARDDLPGARANAMQRNKVVFDSPAALEAALASPVMADMRADSAGFAPVSQRATHFVMATWRLA